MKHPKAQHPELVITDIPLSEDIVSQELGP